MYIRLSTLRLFHIHPKSLNFLLHRQSSMSWDRYELGQKNIFYDEKLRLFPAQVLPLHVERVRQSTLDFSCALRGATDPSLLSDHSLQALVNGLNPEPALKAAQKAQREAVNIVNGGFKETKWATFFETHFFSALSDSLSVSKEDSRRISRSKYYYDGIKREIDESWTLFSKDNVNGLGSFERIKCPKPDHAFFLPIYHSANNAGSPAIADAEARQWNQTQVPLGTEPFSWSTLKKLNGFGLQSTPRRIFDKPPLEANLKCYPWFIVEHKKENESERNVSCQAANAAACAISLVKHSAQYALKLLDQAHVPPIPAMTTIGSRVTIWLMYYAKDFDAPCSRRSTNEVTTKKRKEGHIMHAVWSGDMTKLMDTLKLQIILDNVHTWAMRVFKPLISTYIEQWHYVHCHPSLDIPEVHAMLSQSKYNRDRTIEQRRAILPIVQGLLEDHASMELDELSHKKVTPLLLGLLMHQICSSEREHIAKEVDRAVEDRLRLFNITPGPHGTGEGSFNQGHDAASRRINPSHSDELPASTSRSTPATQITPVDVDDPDDSDWRESQHPSSASSQAYDDSAESSDAEASVAQSSEYEFSEHSTVWRASEDVETPRATPSQSLIPERPKTHGRNSSPVSPGATTGSAGSTPRPNGMFGQLISDTAPESPASPLASQHQRTLKVTAPSGSSVFAGQLLPGKPVWPPGRRFAQLKRSNSPVPRQLQQTSEQEHLVQSEGRENNSYIDLTKESQDESDHP
ncbi:hypothetical protein FAUST_3841 [Fusarium austroamericanum]|uniref:Uncharacterized protein n=1 Tax=Fusarium austroamericanum TaxID=282268 RepID=A0AAN6C4E8_FUSAU|nr:hypothetical protein FAUST_3841 [Fusarium austroamericanum]